MPALIRVVLGLIVLILTAGCGSASTPPEAAPGPVVLLLTTGVSFEDLSPETPALNDLVGQGALADLVPRSVQATACPVDGALAISSGRRADAERGTDEQCVTPQLQTSAPGGRGTLPQWQQHLDRAAAASFDARLGLLGDTLAEHGRRSAAIGPLAATALATSSGTVDSTWTTLEALPQALDSGADLVVADLPTITADPATGSSAAADADRLAQTREVDAAVGAVRAAVPPDTTVVLASIADRTPAPGAQPARMQMLAMVGPPSNPDRTGLLFSPSTRHSGLVVTPDLTATVLGLVGVPVPSDIDGARLRVETGSADQSLRRVVDLQQETERLTPLRIWFFVVGLALPAVVAVVAFGLARRAGIDGAGRRSARISVIAALMAAASPAAGVLSGLVPWWRAGLPALALFGTGLAAAALIVALALGGLWRRHPVGPAVVVAASTVLVLTLDVATGSTLTLNTPLGGEPLIGGRFYGFHNPLFAVFGTAVLWVCLGLATWLDARDLRRFAAPLIGLIGLIASVINVLPSLGADVGGPPALLPAAALLALRAAGVRLTWLRLLMIAGGTALLLAVVFVADWLRPADQRTHLGRFVQTLIDGGGWNVVQRKLVQNAEILTANPITMAMPVAMVAVIWVLAQPNRFGLNWLGLAYRQIWLLSDTLVALIALSVLGFAANDSGTSIPPAVAMLTLPLLLAVTVRARLGDHPPVAEPTRSPQ